jgi:hypothetical protein
MACIQLNLTKHADRFSLAIAGPAVPSSAIPHSPYFAAPFSFMLPFSAMRASLISQGNWGRVFHPTRKCFRLRTPSPRSTRASPIPPTSPGRFGFAVCINTCCDFSRQEEIPFFLFTTKLFLRLLVTPEASPSSDPLDGPLHEYLFLQVCSRHPLSSSP